MLPGRGQRDVLSHKPKLRRIKAKHQRKRFMRAKDPVLAVFMWGVQHTVSDLPTGKFQGSVETEITELLPKVLLILGATYTVLHGAGSYSLVLISIL